MSSTVVSDRLRVLLAGFDVEPNMPAGVAGLPVEVVHRARTAADAAASAQRVRADVVLGDAALVSIASLQHSGAVALLRSALSLDVVEAVLAVASIRAFCAIES